MHVLVKSYKLTIMYVYAMKNGCYDQLVKGNKTVKRLLGSADIIE